MVVFWNKATTKWNEGVELDKKNATISKSLAKINFLNVKIWSKNVLDYGVLYGGGKDCTLK